MESISGELKMVGTNYELVRGGNPRLDSQIINDPNFDYSKRLLFESIYSESNIKSAVLKTDFKNHFIRKIRGVIKYRILQRKW